MQATAEVPLIGDNLASNLDRPRYTTGVPGVQSTAMTSRFRVLVHLVALSGVLLTTSCTTQKSSMPLRPQRVEIQKEEDKTVATLKNFRGIVSQQESWLWCWAACTEMIQKFTETDRNGVAVETQEEIVRRVKGLDSETSKAKIEAASRYELLCALNPDLQPQIPFGTIWDGISNQIERNPDLLLNPTISLTKENLAFLAAEKTLPDRRLYLADLEAGYPIVVGLRESDAEEAAHEGPSGHAYVLVGASYTKTSTLSEEFVKGTTRFFSWIFGIFTGNFTASENLAIAADVSYKRVKPDGFDIHSVQLVDPALPMDDLRLSFEEFEQRLMFAMSPSAAREQLLMWRGLVKLNN